jgi:type VI secretion system FHA domain protein
MSLTLTVLRCPDNVAPETRHVAGGEFTIGRAPECDWILPDPDRHLSKRHCILAFRSGRWQLADVSTNGTYLNRDAEPIGRGGVRDLDSGDRLRFGAYEIEIRIDQSDAGSARAAVESRPRAGGRENPFDDDPLISPHDRAAPFDAHNASLPSDFDSLGPDLEARDFVEPVQADHSPSIEDAFRPPRSPPALLPDDWDAEFTPRPSATPQRASHQQQESQQRSPPQPRIEPTPAAPPVRAPSEDHGLLDAFLRGAGLPDARPDDPVAMMEALGRAFRATVAGLRETLIARAAIKGEFRIEQTLIRARGNNPLKFAAGDDDALGALLGVGRRTDMAPAEAVADALRSLREHELASLAAMQSAARSLLASLNPALVRGRAEQSGVPLLASVQKARAWDAFEALYARTVLALSDDFDSVFGRAFARAYEQALCEMEDNEADARPVRGRRGGRE